jgi:hypothetical protein
VKRQHVNGCFFAAGQSLQSIYPSRNSERFMQRENAEKGSLKEFLQKVNSDHEFRAEFLSNPVGVLRDYGITLSESAQTELKQLVAEYRENMHSMSEELWGTTTTTTTTTTTVKNPQGIFRI